MSILDSLGEFGEMAGNVGNNLLVAWSEGKASELRQPKESGISAQSPEKAVEQNIQPATTQQADQARAAANIGGELRKYLPYAAGALAVLALLRARVF